MSDSISKRKKNGQISKIIVFGQPPTKTNKEVVTVIDNVKIRQSTVKPKAGTDAILNTDTIGYSKDGENFVNSTLLCVIETSPTVLPFECVEVSLCGPLLTGILSLEVAGNLEFRIVVKPFVKSPDYPRKPSNQIYTLTITFHSVTATWQSKYKFCDAGHDHKRAKNKTIS